MPSKAKALPGTGEEIARLEDAVLGSLLFGSRSWEAFSQCDAEDLRPEDFSGDHRANLYREIRALAIELGKAAPSGTVAEAPTTLTLCEWLTSRGTDGACGGLSYVIRVADVAGGSLIEIRHLISRVKEAARRRSAYETARALLEALEGARPVSEVTLEYSQTLASAAGEEAPSNVQTGADLASSVLWHAQNPDAGEEYLSTGIPDVDRLLSGGLVQTRLYLVAGRPGHGKSALGLNMARGLAKQGNRVHFQSLEMSATKAPAPGYDTRRPGDLAFKLAQMDSGLSSETIKAGERGMRPHQYEALHRAAFELAEWPLTTDDTPGLHYLQLFSRLRRLKARHPDLKAVIIDYIGLIKGDKGQKTLERIAAASNGLKEIAKALDIAIVCLSQLNRDCEKRPDKRPRVDDLRGCGDLEQDADAILLVSRPGLYEEWKDAPGMWISKPKDRHSETGSIVIGFDGPTQRITGPEIPDPVRQGATQANNNGPVNTSWKGR